MKLIFLAISSFGCFQIGSCQISDTLEVVPVYSKKDSVFKMASLTASVPFYTLNDYVLQNMGVIDIGEALKHVPGANIKDYGGIGGLKTINYRSLGSAHTGIEQDGITLTDQQTGSINLGSTAIFGIESADMSSGQIQHRNAFASAYLKASMISIFNTIATPSTNRILVKTQTEFLTINSLQNGILVKQKIGEKLTLGGQASYRCGNGMYNYSIANGQSTVAGKRSAVDLDQSQLKGAIRYKHKKLNITLLGNYQLANQNLPGAVVFYNPKSKETLNQESNDGAINIKYTSKKQSFSGHGFMQTSKSQYFQDYVLNSQGFIKNDYHQHQKGTGLIYHYFLGSLNQSMFFGTDFIHSKFKGSQYEITPTRTSLNSVVGITKWLGKFKFQGNLTHQKVNDKSIENEQVLSHFSPFLSIGVAPFKNRSFRIRTYYKNAFRMPSFNDLYYRSIGNIDLSPENANMLNLGFTYEREFSTFNLESTIDLYQNRVDHKIIAIPTKNLFNWSIQNIGKTQGRGVDINLLLSHSFQKSKLLLSTNQSINQSIDVTHKDAYTYGHQLPYTPVYFASYHFNLQHKCFTTAFNVLHSGGRYVLTENINSNYLDGFIDFGMNVSHIFKFNNAHSLVAKVQANNILNNNYQIVRSFPMPGRHYVFTVQYQYSK